MELVEDSYKKNRQSLEIVEDFACEAKQLWKSMNIPIFMFFIFRCFFFFSLFFLVSFFWDCFSSFSVVRADAETKKSKTLLL